MKRFWLIAFLILSFAESVFADIVTIDPVGWSQEKRNMTQAMVVKLLFDNSVSHDGVNISLPQISVANPSLPIAFLTTQSISDAYDIWKADMDIKVAEAIAEQQAKDTELQTNQFRDLKLPQINSFIDNQVDAISNLAEAKAFLRVFCKLIVKYIKANGL